MKTVPVEVLLPMPVDRPFTYLSDEALKPGTIVRVPIGKKEAFGVVWPGESKTDGELKDVIETVGRLPMHVVGLVSWLAAYHLAPLGLALKTALPKDFSKRGKRKTKEEKTEKTPIILTDEQQNALNGIELGRFKVTLLNGLTGSGKTEVYLKAAENVLSRGKQALVLVPEIALSGQLSGRFRAHFPDVDVWHSGLTPAQRGRTWNRVLTGESRLILAARSGLFLPFKNPGLIVVDEEHEPSYKQEESPHYQGRDTAVMLGKMTDTPVILATATPSIETLVNVEQNRFNEVRLVSRFRDAQTPAVHVVDMKACAKDDRIISPALRDALQETLACGEQALLYLNRRGYAPTVLCGKCGEAVTCPHCSIALVEHKKYGKLLCHYCGYSRTKPDVCPICGVENKLISLGVGAEQAAALAQVLFPDARIALMTSDYVGKRAEKLIRQMEEREIDVLVGTQMLAKGYHFPNLTLVGIVDADIGFSSSDLRAPERTFQLLTQVAGRSGREANKAGRAVVQTYNPAHPVIDALVKGDATELLRNEIKSRSSLRLPPFAWLAGVTVSGKDLDKVLALCRDLSARFVPFINDRTELLGPAPAPLYKLKGEYRYRFLLKAARTENLQDLLTRWLGEARPAVRIDVNPYNFM